mmetsp:Transcript_16638/g.19756  ORF Transcript_16638/g.19756 Transcript_16638/m.19756 type:complete len:81 (-) Transcript_16638:46-288(-)
MEYILLGTLWVALPMEKKGDEAAGFACGMVCSRTICSPKVFGLSILSSLPLPGFGTDFAGFMGNAIDSLIGSSTTITVSA